MIASRGRLPAIPPSCLPSSSCLSSSSCPLSYPLSLCLGFSFSSRLIVLVEVAREGEEVSSSEVGSSEVGSSEVGSSEVGSSEVGSSGKVSLSEKVVLVLLAIEAGAIKEGSGFLPPSRALGRAVKASSGSCHQGRCGSGVRFILYRQIRSGVRFMPCR